MNTLNTSHDAATPVSTPVPAPSALASYEAPTIETIVSSDDLQREVLYAGTGLISDPDVPAFP